MKQLKNRRGQTAIEYLLLLAMTFIVSYIMVRGPVSTFTQGMFQQLLSGIRNVITHAEWSSEEYEFGRAGHPTSPNRLQPLHL